MPVCSQCTVANCNFVVAALLECSCKHGILYAYRQNFVEYMKLEDKGVLTVPGEVNDEALEKAMELGQSI
ncbi:hypothetical protein P261_02426 [Lachnospiraceae bacterium TWA4]|nr:hypothetical protein P261_02426 [Lachnospiraceae bacterium TWA4]